jgi:hypothetical protein
MVRTMRNLLEVDSRRMTIVTGAIVMAKTIRAINHQQSLVAEHTRTTMARPSKLSLTDRSVTDVRNSVKNTHPSLLLPRDAAR